MFTYCIHGILYYKYYESMRQYITNSANKIFNLLIVTNIKQGKTNWYKYIGICIRKIFKTIHNPWEL